MRSRNRSSSLGAAARPRDGRHLGPHDLLGPRLRHHRRPHRAPEGPHPSWGFSMGGILGIFGVAYIALRPDRTPEERLRADGSCAGHSPAGRAKRRRPPSRSTSSKPVKPAGCRRQNGGRPWATMTPSSSAIGVPEPLYVPWRGRMVRIRHDDPTLRPYWPNTDRLGCGDAARVRRRGPAARAGDDDRGPLRLPGPRRRQRGQAAAADMRDYSAGGATGSRQCRELGRQDDPFEGTVLPRGTGRPW